MNDLCNIRKIENLLADIEYVANALYANSLEEAQSKLNAVFEKISQYYTYLLTNSPRYAGMGILVPIDVLYCHIANMQEAINCRDLLQLADTLMYEITEGLKLLIELIGSENDSEEQS